MQYNIYKLLLVLVLSLGIFGSASAAGPTLNAIADQNATEDQVFTLDITLSVPADNGSVTFTDDTNLFEIQKVSETQARISFTPTNEQVGTYNINITARDLDAGSPDVKAFKLTIANVNDAPVLSVPGVLQLKENTAFMYQVNATDVDRGDSLAYSYATSWINFKMDSAGKISFTPNSADIGAHTVDITVKDVAGASDTKQFRFFVLEACSDGSLTFSSIEINDVTGEDDNLLPGDYLEAEFDAKNNLLQDLSDVRIKAWVENLNGDRASARVESAKTDIDSKDSKSLLMKLRLYLSTKKGTHTLYIRAEGDDENGTAKCAWYQKDLTVDRETHNLLIDSVGFMPEAAVCGGSASTSATIWNIGTSSEDDVKLRFRNPTLGIDKTTEIFNLDNSGSDAKATKLMVLDIPGSAKAGNYPIEVTASFNSGEDSITFVKNLNVSCDATASAAASTTAAEGKATIAVTQATATTSREQIVKYTLTLTNTEKQAVNYKLSLSGVADWASGAIEPEDITLAPGASVPVYVYITPKEDASAGEHISTVTIKSGATILDSKTLTTAVQAPATTITELGNKASLKPAGLGLANISEENRDSALFVVVFLVAVILAGFLIARDRSRAKVKVYGSELNKKEKGDED